jgi:N-acetylglucosaminyldiphosphoundecaprenol N-acetyl-beta-D-mannosaminyltransferase
MRQDTPIQPLADSIPTPATDQILGIPIALIDYQRTLEWIDAMTAEREKGYLCVCNTHTVTASQEDHELRSALIGASLNVPDGQPLVWALNALGHSLTDRVYGPELMARACSRAASNGQRFYLYGGHNQGALARLALKLRQRYPGIRIVGGYSPPHRPLTREEQAVVAAEINDATPEVVGVGLGVPKLEKWMAAVRPLLDAPVLIGVGLAFDVHADLVSQAPSWMQRAGLEWSYRLAREPRRLWRRYLRYNPRFVGAFARQLLAHRNNLRAAPRRGAGRNSR